MYRYVFENPYAMMDKRIKGIYDIFVSKILTENHEARMYVEVIHSLYIEHTNDNATVYEWNESFDKEILKSDLWTASSNNKGFSKREIVHQQTGDGKTDKRHENQYPHTADGVFFIFLRFKHFNYLSGT